MLPPILAEIERHTRSVLDGSSPCRTESCPSCDATGPFLRHAVRRRVFLVILAGWVRRVRGLVCRYRCSSCGTTFTGYPAFAIPRKHYVVRTILSHAGAYVHDDDATYRSTTKASSGAPTFYGPPADTEPADLELAAIDDRSFAHTTLWRWMACLAAMKRTTAHAKRLLREASTAAFHACTPVAPKKARSSTRYELLDRAADLIHTEAAFRSAFPPTSIFTGLATRLRFA